MSWGPEHVWLVAICGFCAYLANVLYMLGGTSPFELSLRRIGSTALLAGSANFSAVALGGWNWIYLLMFVSLFLGFSKGYGASTLWEKILKRTLFALGIAATCLIGCAATGWTPSGLIILCVSVWVGIASVLLGIWNPWDNAPVEQFVICQVLTLLIPFFAFIR